MSWVWQLVKKDIRRLRGVVLLWGAALVAWTVAGALMPAVDGHSAMGVVARIVLMVKSSLQTLLVVVIVPLLIHQDSLVDSRAFWLTRPVSRAMLLAGKAAFLAGVLVVPALLGEMVVIKSVGYGWHYVLLAVPEILLETASQVCLMGVLAVLTSSFAQYAVALLSYLFAYGVLYFVGNAALSSLFTHTGCRTGAGPMMMTGVLQAQDLAGWLVMTIAGGLIMIWQFLTRKREAALVAGVVGVLLVILVKGALPTMLSGGNASHEEGKPAVHSITVRNLRASAGGYGSRWLDAALEVNGAPTSLFGEVVSGTVSITCPALGILNGTILANPASKFYRYGYDLRQNGAMSRAAVEAMKSRYGEIRLTKGPEGAPPSVEIMPVMLLFPETDARIDGLYGNKGSATGTVEITFSQFEAEGAIPLRVQAVIGSGLDRDRVVALESDTTGTRIAIRKTMANIALSGEKFGQTMQERMGMLSGSLYALINHASSNEVVMCQASNIDDVFFMMTTVTRMGTPPRLDHVDAKLVFPPLTRDWLKHAELVCLKRKATGAWKWPFEAGDLVIQASGKEEPSPSY